MNDEIHFTVYGNTVEQIRERAHAELDRVTESQIDNWDLTWSARAVMTVSGRVFHYEAQCVARWLG